MQAMATRFSEQSLMNLEWSAKCLEENRWVGGSILNMVGQLGLV